MLACAAVAGLSSGAAQVAVTSVLRLPIEARTVWNAPRFSPDGQRIFLTSEAYDGIWEFRRSDSRLRQLSADRRAGFGFALSPDGRELAFRRLKPGTRWQDRQQELVVVQLSTGKQSVRASGREVSLPAFAGNALTYSTGKSQVQFSAPVASEAVAILGIEETKIALLRGRSKELLDPFGGGSYVWPSLSPDRTKIVAYEMGRGTFVCDLRGTVLARLGRRDAPVWTRDGRWIVFMDEKDDGQRILTSDIAMVSSDGKTVIALTSTPDVLEMYPDCSPVDNTIAFSTMRGEVFLLRYEEGTR
jgi:Tol biopolymer transport system component